VPPIRCCAVRGGYSGAFAAPPGHTNVRLYGDENPLDAPGFEAKVKLLAEIDAYVRDKDPRVRQVSVSLGATWQVVEILRPDGESYRDIRPLVRVNVSVVAGSGDRQETRQPRLRRPRGLCALHRDQGMA
jgi:TldD protein